jgi:hypothetical protein
MNPQDLLDDVSAQSLDLEWLLHEIEPVSEYGRREIAATPRLFVRGHEREAQRRAESIAAIARKLDASRVGAIHDIVRSAPDALGAIVRAAMGDVLTDADFLEVLRFCDAFARARTLTAEAPSLGARGIEDVETVTAALEPGRAGTSGFYLHEKFDATLGRSRDTARKAQAEYDAVRGRTVERVAGALGRDDLGGGNEFIIMRADMLDALPAGVRVVRDAPTYILCELDLDDPSRDALRRREAAASAVGVAEEVVRAGLSNTIRAHAEGLERAAVWFGELDAAVAAVHFSQTYSCAPAEIVDEPIVSFADGRFLPLAAELSREARAYTPIALDLTGVAVLTGPNMGGKSVALRTCGLVALCAALGLPVPATSARVGLFDRIAWLGIGLESEPGGLLSSFAKEVVGLRDVLARDDERALVLIDEFARTTTPHEGRALLVALVERLRARDACALVATHLAGVSQSSRARHFAVRGLRGIPEKPPTDDLAQALRALAASMDYTLAEVTGDGETHADAIALASLLGLDDAFIASAYKALTDG